MQRYRFTAEASPTLRNVAVIGASSSLGRALLSRFDDSKLVGSFYSADGPSRGGDAKLFPLDLTDGSSIRSFADSLRAEVPSLDVAIFAAGAIAGRRLAEYEDDEIERIVSVNFTGQAKLIRAMLPLFANDSHLVMISSISAQRGSYDSLYAAAKGAVLSLVKALAAELAPRVRVNAIAPSLIEGSGMYEAMSAERREHHRRQSPTGQLLTLAECAGVIHDICGDSWKHLNGACIDLNGGQHVR